MTIEQLDKIDIIGTNENKTSLVISDHLEWDAKNEKLLLLQDKLNTYLAFVESGEIYEQYPDALDKSIEIKLVSKYHPNQEALKFLNLASGIIQSAGFVLVYEVRDCN